MGGLLTPVSRGFAAFRLFPATPAAHCRFVCRIRDNSVLEVIGDRPLADEAVEAGVVSDRIARPGRRQKREEPAQPLRLVQVACTPPRRRRHSSHGGPGQGETLPLAADLVVVEAGIIARFLRIAGRSRFSDASSACRDVVAP